MSDLKVLTSEGAEIVLDETVIEEFKLKLGCVLLTQQDDDYEEVRKVWNGMIDKRPALIVRCTGVADVIDSVNFARTHSLLLSIRGGGHNVAGSAVCDGGLTIDLSLMKGIRVDPTNRLAQAQGGATWGDLDRETQAFGLATPGGVVTTTGIAGLTLGGGLGWIRRKYGLSCDNLKSVDIITANGEFRTASETENSDLFWGVRGGGGNFGVVTSFEFHLHPVGPEVMLAATMYPVENAREIIQAWREFCANSSDDVSSVAIFWSVPSNPMFPEDAQGKRVAIIAALYAGSADKGEQVLQPLRELATPLIDMSGKMPYTAVQSMFDPFFPKQEQLYYFKSTDLDNLDDKLIDAIIPRAVDPPSPKSLVDIWHYGGAMSRIGIDKTPFAGREKPFLLNIVSVWDNPQDSDNIIAWTREYLASIRPFTSGGLYVNFSGFGEEGEDLVRETYGTNYDRLVEVKNKYDPTNLFRVNQNIKPSL